MLNEDLIERHLLSTGIKPKLIKFIKHTVLEDHNGAPLYYYYLYHVTLDDRTCYYIAAMTSQSLFVFEADAQKLFDIFPDDFPLPEEQ